MKIRNFFKIKGKLEIEIFLKIEKNAKIIKITKMEINNKIIIFVSRSELIKNWLRSINQFKMIKNKI